MKKISGTAATRSVVGGLGMLAGLACAGSIDGAGSGPGPGSPGGDGTTAGEPRSGSPAAPATGKGGASGGGGGAALAVGPMPPRVLRHLTRAEYNNSVRDLLGVAVLPENRNLAAEMEIFTTAITGFPYPRGVDAVSKGDYKNLRGAAEELARKAVANLSSLLACDPAAMGEPACARSFVESFGPRAYRRPLVADEITALMGLYDKGRGTLKLGFADTIGLLIEGILQSANFLYLREFGPSADPYEVASGLSYFLWSSAPDAELLKAAQTAQLTTLAGVEQQARRLLANTKKANDTLRVFSDGWMELDRLPEATKNAKLYPTFSVALAQAMANETRGFISDVLTGGDRTLKTLLTSSTSPINTGLAALYGYPVAGLAKDQFQKVTLDPKQRAGLLTQAAFLTRTGDPDGSLPPRRGKVIYENVLCRLAPPVPDGVPDVQPPSPKLTTRQRFAEHLKAECASCHKVFDPLGFAFEHYDGIGAYRATEAGQAIDATGTVTLDGQEHAFKNAVELMALFSQSPEVARCFATQWAWFAMQRKDTPADKPTLDAVADAFLKKGYDVRELLVAIALNTFPSGRK